MSDIDWCLPNAVQLDIERRDKETVRRLTLMAEAFADGKLTKSRDVLRLARKLGCTTQEIDSMRRHPAVLGMAREIIKAQALYATAEALPSQAELAKTDTKAFATIAKVAEVLDQGLKIQTNVHVDQRQQGDTRGNALWFNKYQRRLEQGAERRLEITDVESREESA